MHIDSKILCFYWRGEKNWVGEEDHFSTKSAGEKPKAEGGEKI